MKSIMRALMCLWYLLCLPVYAHEALPVVLNVVQKNQETVDVSFRLPPVFQNNQPLIEIDGPCQVHDQTGFNHSYLCDKVESIKGIHIYFPPGNIRSPVILRVSYLNGQRETLVMSRGDEYISLPDVIDKSSVLWQYAIIGVEHILYGTDHILFLLCLVLIATGRKLIYVITSFTLGHAVTISFGAMGLVNVNIQAVEVFIALSIVFLAAEILRRDYQSLTYRYPWVVAFLFGLLHGLGFASALADIGLPSIEIPMALLGFNLGVEFGQLIFVAALLLLACLGKSLHLNILNKDIDSRPYKVAVAIPAGLVASVWFFLRFL